MLISHVCVRASVYGSCSRCVLQGAAAVAVTTYPEGSVQSEKAIKLSGLNKKIELTSYLSNPDQKRIKKSFIGTRHTRRHAIEKTTCTVAEAKQCSCLWPKTGG
jgi:hypothetical protein